MGFEPFAVTVNLVILTIRQGALQVLLVQRGEGPFEGWWALPGGFVRPDEDLAGAAVRELAEETGLHVGRVHLEQLASYGAPERDPRMRTVSVAHLALAGDLGNPVAGTDAADAQWWSVDDLPSLAFDHARILADGVERARAKLEYSSVGLAFCPSEFTVAQLRAVYEAVWGHDLDPRNFHRKVTGVPGFLVPTSRYATVEAGRPAQLYTAGTTTDLHPPVVRPHG